MITDWDGYCEMDGLCLQIQFNPLQYSTPCFREIQRTIGKFRQNKRISVAKATLREKQCWRHHNRVMVINIAWGWYKTRHVDLLGENWDPDVNIHSYTTSFLTKSPKIYTGEQRVSSKNGARKTVYPHAEENRSLLLICMKTNSVLIKTLTITRNSEIVEEKGQKTHQDIGIHYDFTVGTPYC